MAPQCNHAYATEPNTSIKSLLHSGTNQEKKDASKSQISLWTASAVALEVNNRLITLSKLPFAPCRYYLLSSEGSKQNLHNNQVNNRQIHE